MPDSVHCTDLLSSHAVRLVALYGRKASKVTLKLKTSPSWALVGIQTPVAQDTNPLICFREIAGWILRRKGVSIDVCCLCFRVLKVMTMKVTIFRNVTQCCLINPLAPELFFLILARPVYKM